MQQTVELPLWLVVITLVLAFIAFVDRMLSPTLRWFFRRRVNRAIEELNTRLQLKIRPFGITRRSILIDRVANDPDVIDAAADFAREMHMPAEVAMARAARYAREIVPAFNAYAYFRVGTRIARWLATALYRVRLGYSNSDALAEVKPDSAVVFVMNHRSNMDYVLVTYLASSSTALSYAVGEWARLPILQTLIRSMGAYFIRRNARNRLYRRVLATYVRMATEAGVTQAMFPEGGLSRDGKLRPPRLGLISYVIAAHEHVAHDTVFIPVGLNYDRVLEDRSLVLETMDGRAPVTTLRRTATTLAFLFKNLRLRLAGRWHRFGYASVSFGKPVSVDEFLHSRKINSWSALDDARRDAMTEELGAELMSAIAALIPVLPVSLVALVLIEAAGVPIDLLTLKARVETLIDRLTAKGAYVHVAHGDRDYEVTAGLRMLTMRRLVQQDAEGRLRITTGEDPLIAYYANAISHLA